MARMMGSNLKKGLCECIDCNNGPEMLGRSAEKRLWQAEAEAEKLSVRDEKLN